MLRSKIKKNPRHSAENLFTKIFKNYAKARKQETKFLNCHLGEDNYHQQLQSVCMLYEVIVEKYKEMKNNTRVNKRKTRGMSVKLSSISCTPSPSIHDSLYRTNVWKSTYTIADEKQEPNCTKITGIKEKRRVWNEWGHSNCSSLSGVLYFYL